MRRRGLLALLFVAGLALGCVPFAKLQAAPVAVVIGVGLIGLTWLSDETWRWKFAVLAALISGAIVAPMLLLAPLAATEGLTDFWISYIVWASQYVGAITPIRKFIQMMNVKRPHFLSSFMFLTTGVLSVGIAFWYGGVRNETPRQRLIFITLLLSVAASVYVILRPGREFTHYLLFLPIPLLTLAGAVWPNKADRQMVWPIWVGSLISCRDLVGIGWNAWRSDYGRNLRVTGAEEFFRSGDLLTWLPALPPRMLVWGWMPEWMSIRVWRRQRETCKR